MSTPSASASASSSAFFLSSGDSAAASAVVCPPAIDTLPSLCTFGFASPARHASAPATAASDSSGSAGRPVSAKSARKPEVIASAPRPAVSCLPSSLPRSVLLPERVTIRAAAIEITSAGIWLTSPSPTVSRVYTSAASITEYPFIATPTAKPPTMFTSVMMMPATASPRTNLPAPSMAP